MAARSVTGVAIASITVTSPAFKDGGMIPIDATCEGRDESPELVFSAMPEGTRSIAIVMDDLDAPGKTFTHLVLYALAPDTLRVQSKLVPTEGGGSVRFGLNDFGAVRYSGPCPPRGEMHKFRLRVFALDHQPALEEGATLTALLAAMDQHILGEGTLTGYFGH
jgi:Raf kinase inhibitor-like YbhB/YbcL family protein